MQYDRNPMNFYKLDVNAVDQKSHKKIYDKIQEENRQILKLDFDNTPDKLRREYLDTYKRVQSEVLNTAWCDKISDLIMTYLGRIDMTRASKFKVEEKIPTSKQGYMVVQLLDGMECQILLDTGASKSFMSKSH